MIFEIDTTILDRIDNLNLNQLVLLNICENQNNKSKTQELLTRASSEDLECLIERGYLEKDPLTNEIKSTEKLKSALKEKKTMFDLFYEQFPIYVTRPDGTKGFLRSNVNKCRKEYNKIVGKSKSMHQHICDCLKFELNQKMITGKMGYMKTMWKWLTQSEWEVSEDQMNISTTEKREERYGDTII